jgi:membrane protease YdiL (CAAX protease family)
MSLAIDLGHRPARPDFTRSFGPVSALILGPLVTLFATFAAAVVAVGIAANLDPGGPAAFFEQTTDELTGVVGQRIEALTLVLSAPMTISLILGLVALRGDVRRILAIGGTLPRKPLLIAFAFVAATVAFEAWLSTAFPSVAELGALPSENAERLRENTALILSIIGAVIGAPLAEELVFRGLVYTAVRERWGYAWALGLSSVFFAAMHFEPTGVYALIVLPSAVLLGWLREKTGGIYAPILIHAVFNAIACAGLVF